MGSFPLIHVERVRRAHLQLWRKSDRLAPCSVFSESKCTGTLLVAMALGLQKSPEGQICLVGLPVGIPSTLALDTYPTSLGGRVVICPQFGRVADRVTTPQHSREVA